MNIIAEKDKYHTYFISETNKERIKIPNIYTYLAKKYQTVKWSLYERLLSQHDLLFIFRKGGSFLDALCSLPGTGLGPAAVPFAHGTDLVSYRSAALRSCCVYFQTPHGENYLSFPFPLVLSSSFPFALGE